MSTGKLKQGLDGFRNFVADVVMEGRKSTWPERQELVESTTVIIVSVLLLTLFIGISDKILVMLLKLVLR